MAQIKTKSATQIDKEKIQLEARFYPKFKAIFKNMAQDVSNLYSANGYVDSVEISLNYLPDFVKELRDVYRATIKKFGFDLRKSLEGSKSFYFNSDIIEKLVDIEQKATITVDDSSLDKKINEINNIFNIESTIFISNQSEIQSTLISETNAKEISLIVEQQEEFFIQQIAEREKELVKLESQLTNLPDKQRARALRQINAARNNIQNQLADKDSIIAKNIQQNLLDRSSSRAALVSDQNVGLAESWSRQTEAQTINNVGLVGANGNLIKISKTWIAILDNKTRTAHAEADLQQVAIDDTYIVDGEALRYPRDPRGSASNIINCRCVSEQSFSNI
jgi:hypothetical protein